VKELSFRRPAVARRFTERPGQRQRTHDRRHDRGAEHAAAEDEASQSDAEMGRQRLADLPDVGQRGARVAGPDRRGCDEQDRGADHLRQHRSEGRIAARRTVVPVVEPLFGCGGCW